MVVRRVACQSVAALADVLVHVALDDAHDRRELPPAYVEHDSGLDGRLLLLVQGEVSTAAGPTRAARYAKAMDYIVGVEEQGEVAMRLLARTHQVAQIALFCIFKPG